MAWYRAESSRHRHRKIRYLARLLGVHRLHAAGLHDVVCSVPTEAGHADGLLDLDAEALALEADWEGDGAELLEALIKARLVDRDDDGRLYVHDYAERRGSGTEADSARARQLAAERAARYRERRRSAERDDRDGDGASRSVTRDVTPYIHTDERTDERTDDRCAELGSADSPPTLHLERQEEPKRDEAVLRFPIVGARKGAPGDWALTTSHLAELGAAFPAVAVEAEARQALAWVNANPRKKKTAAGMPEFLRSWMARAQNRGGSRLASGPSSSPTSTSSRGYRGVDFGAERRGGAR